MVCSDRETKHEEVDEEQTHEISPRLGPNVEIVVGDVVDDDDDDGSFSQHRLVFFQGFQQPSRPWRPSLFDPWGWP